MNIHSFKTFFMIIIQPKYCWFQCLFNDFAIKNNLEENLCGVILDSFRFIIKYIFTDRFTS